MQLLLNSRTHWMVCGLLIVYYYYMQLYAIVMNLFVLSHMPSLDQSPCTWYSLWNSHHMIATPHLVLLHVLWELRFQWIILKFYTRISTCNHTYTVMHEWSYVQLSCTYNTSIIDSHTQLAATYINYDFKINSTLLHVALCNYIVT